MRKSIAIKTLLRAPAKAVVTFLLIAAASFALFSRVTDYAVTTRESAKAESFYHGVAALDNSTPPMGEYYLEPKPWPSEGQLEKITSLPGVTLTDMRYTTDGLIEDYKRVIDQDSSGVDGEFVAEGTYEGYEEYGEAPYIRLYLQFSDVKVHVGEINIDTRFPTKVGVNLSEEMKEYYKPYSRSYFDEMKKGGRFLIVGTYSERVGAGLNLDLWSYSPEESLLPIDGLGEGYLETEEFARYKGLIEAREQGIASYDIVYTSDMRAIPYVNERKMVVSEGRPLTSKDRDVCVVSEQFMETYGLSIGDKLHIELGDRLLRGQGVAGTRPKSLETMAHFIASADLEIIGSYRFTNDWYERLKEYEWSYGPGTVFVHSSLLPVEVPKDHETLMGDYSIYIEDPNDIGAFQEAAEQLAADMGLGLRFSDGGWYGMKDNFEIGSLASFLTTVLYILGAALALLLAVYLYIGRNRNSYAIMRTLGVPARRAQSTLTLPFYLLSAVSMAVGGITGLSYASYTAGKTLANMSGGNAPEGYVYVLDAAIPAGVVALCLVCEWLFIAFVTIIFLRSMKKMSPLDLLQEGKGGVSMAKRAGIWRHPFAGRAKIIVDTAPIPKGLDMEKLSMLGSAGAADVYSGEAKPISGKYSALRQVSAYIMRHMKRGVGKTAVSLALTVVLAAGIGTFVLARLSYQEAYRDLDVKGRALQFSSSYVMDLMKSDLIEDIYYYNKFSVRVNGVGILSPISFTNNLDRYLPGGYSVTYGEGYDSSIFEGTGPVCLVGQALAKKIGVKPGDEIKLMSEDLYSFMPEVYEADKLEFAVERAGKPYKVVGILESEDPDMAAGIFAAINQVAENLYSQPFPVDYCEFTLADNEKVVELNGLLEEQKSKGIQYSPLASYHINSDLFENTKRVLNLLESLFPIAVAAAALIGLFGPGLVILQSAKEAAFLRILGVTKKRARCMLVFEQVVLSVVGIALVAVALAASSQGLFARGIGTLAFCWGFYFLGCICGASVAAVQVTRHKALELLQVKE